MYIKNIFFLLLSVLATQFLFAQNKSFSEEKGNWGSYIQTRFSTDFDKTNDFMIRRAKIWIEENIPGLDNVSYKIQANYRSNKDESLMLQDAFANIRIGKFGAFRVGRFVPDFLLQRMQPDYDIPVLERAAVINNLIHSSKSMARQIGAQFTFHPDKSPLRISFGVFNANLEAPGKNKDKNLLYTTHTQINLMKNDDLLFELGVSGAYRYVNSLSMNTIYSANQLITGNDFRFGFEMQLHYKEFCLQSEYDQANIKNDHAWGYYILADYSFTKNIQVAFEVEKFSDFQATTSDNEWYGIGLNYYFTERTKMMTDFRTQFSSIKNNYLGEVQFQVFLN